MHVADAPIDVSTATQSDVSPRQRPVVVTLVHGTVLFARWPRVLRLVDTLERDVVSRSRRARLVLARLAVLDASEREPGTSRSPHVILLVGWKHRLASNP